MSRSMDLGIDFIRLGLSLNTRMAVTQPSFLPAHHLLKISIFIIYVFINFHQINNGINVRDA